MNPDHGETRSVIKSILVDVLELDIDPAEIGDEELLFDGQLGMDSTAVIEVLTGIEDAFEIQFEDEEIGPDLFRSVSSLARAVDRHLGQP
jgi:acyl carrier protein